MKAADEKKKAEEAAKLATADQAKADAAKAAAEKAATNAEAVVKTADPEIDCGRRGRREGR